VDEIFARFQAADPDPRTELLYDDNFTLLVAVVLSAQATDVGVNRATPDLFRMANTPEKMVALGEAGVTEKIKTIGLYRNKAKNVVALSKMLIEEHDGEVPGTLAELEALPGVGRKTANVVLNVAFGQPTIGIDTHAFRVANRTGLAPGKTPLKVEEILNRIVPERYKHNVHHWLILQGRYVCKARKPDCWRCIIADICIFKPKTEAPA
jgi:endonuclease-3